MSFKKIALSSNLALFLLLSFVWSTPLEQARAHEIPVSARLNLFFRPETQTLIVLVRVPLAALGDVDYPTRAGNFVVVSKADQALRNIIAQSVLPAFKIYENDQVLGDPQITAIRMALPSDRSFESFEQANQTFANPRLDDDLDLYWSQQLVDVRFEYAIHAQDNRFSLDLLVDRFGQSVTTSVRFIPDQKQIRAYEWHGNAGLVYLDPGWQNAFLNFLQGGFLHILSGSDHLLFLLALLLPMQSLRMTIVIVSTFTLAHAMTLMATYFDFIPTSLWFAPLIEALIASTILYTAAENIVSTHLQWRWISSFWFGIIHGFGFSFGLKESLQFAGDHLLVSLLAFNLGIELAQILFILVGLFCLRIFYARLEQQRAGMILLSAVIGHSALHWMMERGEILSKFPLPTFDVVFAISFMRALMLCLALVLFLWVLFTPINRFLSRGSSRFTSRGIHHM